MNFLKEKDKDWSPFLQTGAPLDPPLVNVIF